jgi:hypothetical protein
LKHVLAGLDMNPRISYKQRVPCCLSGKIEETF